MTADSLTKPNGGWSDPFDFAQTSRPRTSRSRDTLGATTLRVAEVWGAPPGIYQHKAHDGLAIYMAMSRKVGSIDVGDAEVGMTALAGEFIVAAPRAAARMHSFRGGHWIEVVLADASLGARSDGEGLRPRDLCLARRAFRRQREIGDLLARIVSGSLAATPPDPLYLDTLGCSLVDALNRFFASEGARRREVPPLPRRVVGVVIAYMDAHLADPVALSDLARLVGMPPTRFVKAFRNATGESPYQTLIRRRLEAARFALMTGSHSITEVSLSCGFSSQQHLTGLFSQRFGIAPGAFRTQIRAS